MEKSASKNKKNKINKSLGHSNIWNEEERVGLFIPPAYDRNRPPLGTPCLVGFLKSKGINVDQGDLNMLYYDYIRRQQLERIFTPEYKKEKIRKKVYYYRILQYESMQAPSYEFQNNPGSSFAFTEMILSSKVLFRYIVDKKENTFVDFFHKKVLPRIENGNFYLIGFSIICPSQVMASFTFGYFIKKYLPKIKIVIGGQWVSFYREELQKRRNFDRFFDYVIYFEGETPLFNLINSIRNNKPLFKIPNLIYKANGKWKISTKITDEDMNKLPSPNFDGLPLKKYFDSKKGVALTFETSRGCYWNKCIFCVDLPLPKPRYREKTANLIIRDIKNLIKKYNVKHLTISNATFSPWQMKEIAKKILKERIKISWWAWGRFDNGFDRETLRLAKRAGCSILVFGLESINQRVLDFIDKGTKVNIIKRIIKDSHDLKLDIYFQTMIGLPSETVEEAFDTVFFLATYPEAMRKSSTFNIYYLTPKNKVFLNPEKYGIKISYNKRLPFRFFYPFKHITGNIDRSKAQKIIIAYNIIRQKTKTYF